MATADTASEYDSCGHRRCWTAAASCPYHSDSRGLVPLLLLPTPRQAGKACSTSCVLFSYWCKNIFDLTAESFACTFFSSCFFFVFGCSPGTYVSTYTYLGSRLIRDTYVLIQGTYVCGTKYVPHTKTKICRTHTRAFFLGMYQFETRFARIIFGG